MNLKDALAALDSAPHWLKRAELRQQWRAEGIHEDRLLSDRMIEAVGRNPQVRVVFGSLERPSEATTGEMLEESFRVAAGLHRLGLVEGDVLVSQVPNWRENTVGLLAALHLGLIYVPMVHIMGPAELRFAMETLGAKAYLAPDRWKKIDFAERIAALSDVATLQHVITIGDGAMPRPVARWAELAATPRQPLPALAAKADDAWLIMFTSGTTSTPKAVVHTHNSFGAEIRFFPSASTPTGRPRLQPLPSGHAAGIIATCRPFLEHESTVMMDLFDAELAADLILKHRPDRIGGVPVIISALLDRAEELFPGGVIQTTIGAASIPPALIERCEGHGWHGTRLYGSTEHPTISGTWPEDPVDKRTGTDGRACPYVQVRIAADDGTILPPGAAGEIVSMGPDLFKGYLDPAHSAANFSSDGWFHTGDIGVLDDEGYLEIVDRKKDIIIRGGENISSKEIEDILSAHPAVLEAAAVAWPDPVLGERIGVFVRLRAPQPFDLDMVKAHFAASGVARQKTPERLVVVEDFARTAAGKVLKTELRTQVAALVADEQREKA